MAASEPHDSSLVGRKLGEFIVREELSAGGFGVVFRAEQPALAREAVIKVLHTRLRASETSIQRFLREARLASRLDHPFAAHIYAFGAEPDGVLWIAMELVRGTPLDKLLTAQGAIPLERFVPLLERICQVVQTAHEQGIVHRDIKPGNVMVLARAGQLLPKLLDLGIAKLDEGEPLSSSTERHAVEAALPSTSVETEDAFANTMAPETGGTANTALSEGPTTAGGATSGKLTEHGAVMGSPLYMAPEQWTDAAAVDARTDIYALAVLSYEALTGKPPFAGANRFAIAMAHAQQPAPPLGGQFPVALDAVLAKALAKNPHNRYASAIELATAFRAASGLADEPTTLPRLDEELRTSVLASAPQPLAQAVALVDTARNAHQARDAVWQVVRVAARLVGVTALSAHAHVGTGGGSVSESSSVHDALRRLGRRALPDSEWLELARELTAPFAKLRDVYPVPELVDLFASDHNALSELIAMRDDADASASDEQMRDMLATLIPRVEQLLRALEFLGDYRLVVASEQGAAAVWMGARRGDHGRLALKGPRVPAGHVALATADGFPVVELYPFVQHRSPGPGVAPQLFFFEGKGRRGARLVALPDAFEVEDEVLLDVVGGLVQEPTERAGTAPIEETCPFPGLASFTAEDSTRFFGRERETEGFVNRLRAQPLLAVVGPSGAGKSSFVAAGVAPNLPADWQVVTLRPGAAPVTSLAARLASIGIDSDVLRRELHEHPGGLGTVLRTRKAAGMLVIVVDQLEELFTLCDDPAERVLFADALVRAARSADDPVRVVFTLRDDFLLAAEALPPLRARLAPALHLLTTPSRDDLLRILTEPLRQAGYELDDPALATDMVDALASTRSALALLSFTASRLWELRDRRFRQISRKAYVSLGGVGGALAHHAEAALDAMVPEERRLLREVFRHAVTAEGTRAVLSRAELDQVLGGGVHAKAVVAKLVDARLLVSGETAGGGEQIELTHEALIDAWPRLVAWRREDAEGARLRDQLRAAARQWEERGRPSGLLWRGDALAEYRLWRARYPGALTDVENAFAAASLADAMRAQRRLRVTIGVAFAALTAGMVTLFFFNRRANEQRAVAQDRQAQADRAASDLRAERRDQAEEQGRSALVELYDAPRALVYLQQAAELGAHGPAHDLLVAFARRVPASQLRRLALPNASDTAEFSADGKRIVAACDDGAAHIFDASDGHELLAVHQQQEVTHAELSRDGAVLLTGGFDGTAVLWNAATGAKLHALTAGPNGHDVRCARLSPDGRLVVTATDHDEATLWSVETGAQLAKLADRRDDLGEVHFLNPCAFSRDSRRVAIGDLHGTTRIWDVTGPHLVATASGHAGQINDVELSADGKLLATASSDGTAAVWDATTGKRVHDFAHRDRVWSASFSPDGRRLATASKDRTAVVWDIATGARQLTLAHRAGVNAARFRSDGEQLATIADDGGAYLWDAANGRSESRLLGHDGTVVGVAYDARGERLVTAGDGAIVWSASPQQPAARLPGHTARISSIDFSRDGALAATTDRTGAIQIWRWSSSTLLRTIAAAKQTRDARFSPDGRTLASAGGDNSVHVWDVESGRELQTITGHTDEVRRIAWDPDGKHVASASFDGTVRVSSIPAAGDPIVLHHGPRANSVAFTPNGLLVTAGADGETRLWDLRDATKPRKVWRYESKGQGSDKPILFDSVHFDATSTHLLGSSVDHNVAVVWSADATPNEGRELRGHRDRIWTSSWSPDGRYAVTASSDGSARLWDSSTGKQLAAFELDQEQVLTVAFAPDGRHVATGAAGGGVLLWELPIR